MTFGGLPPRRPDQYHMPRGPSMLPAPLTDIVARRVTIIGPNGLMLVYSGPPVPNNLVESVSPVGGTDSQGNIYLPGFVTYGRTSPGYIAVQQFVQPVPRTGAINFWTAASETTGWTAVAAIDCDRTGNMSLGSTGTFGISAGAGNPVDIAAPLYLSEQASAPATPTGGGVFYIDATGHLHYLGPAGTDTVLAGP